MRKIALIMLFALPLFSASLSLKEGFVAAHTEMMIDSTINPMATHLEANIEMDDDVTSLRGEVTVRVTDFSSDNSDRDKNMHETLESDKFEEMAYTIRSVTKQESGNYSIDGELNLHGVSKPVSFEGEITNSEESVVIRAKSSVLFSDFDVEMPCLLFMCVRDQVDLFIKASFSK